MTCLAVNWRAAVQAAIGVLGVAAPGLAPAALAAGTGGDPASRPLNNCVTELLNVPSPLPRSATNWGFVNPRPGWVLFRSTADITAGEQLSVSLEKSARGAPARAPRPGADLPPGPPVLVHAGAQARRQEGMRFLPQGRYALHVHTDGQAALRSLVVRAIPELIFCKFQYDPHLRPQGPYDWAFLQRSVAADINCIVGNGAAEHSGFIKAWKAQGKRWIIECGVPGLGEGQTVTFQQAYDYWTGNEGLRNPDLDGVIADEFLPERRAEKYTVWRDAVRALRADERHRGQWFYPYCTSIYRDEASAEFVRTVVRAGYPFVWERYLPEPPTETQASAALEARLAAEMRRWHEAIPGCVSNLVVCFGYMSIPGTETLNLDAQVDYKVWMDLQFQHVATQPAFRGLYGLMEYTCGYADEETVRWAARLYRHYGLEGRTELLSPQYGFNYRLEHLTNPDFANGTAGWNVTPAQEGSVAAKSMKGFAWLEGRYPRTDRGDTFLWLRRSDARPNSVAQPIQNLKPGRLYSLKLVSADYQELQRGQSRAQQHALALQLEGVDLLPAKSIQFPIPNNYAHGLGPFNDRNLAWMNYHFRVFRARGQSAQLTISDWASPTEPKAPAGQELVLNFVELQPYLED